MACECTWLRGHSDARLPLSASLSRAIWCHLPELLPPFLAPQDTIKQQEWKIDRLTRDNRALEATNCDLRAKVESIREENLQVGRK